MDEIAWRNDKEAKRTAADKFLRATVEDASLRERVLADPDAARKAFEGIGGITIPPRVKVICVDSTTEARDGLVVFVLPAADKPLPAEPWRESWVAAWAPY